MCSDVCWRVLHVFPMLCRTAQTNSIADRMEAANDEMWLTTGINLRCLLQSSIGRSRLVIAVLEVNRHSSLPEYRSTLPCSRQSLSVRPTDQ
jgi:hypothetical protein